MSVGSSKKTSGSVLKPLNGPEQDRLEQLDTIGFGNEPFRSTAEQQKFLADTDTLIASIPFNSVEFPIQVTVLPEISSEQSQGQTIDVPRANQDQLFSKLGGTATEMATNVVVAVSEAIPGAVKDTVDALGGLAEEVGLTNILNMFGGKETSRGPVAPPEKQEEILAMRQAREIVAREEARFTQQEYEEMIKAALRMGVNVETLADKLQAPHLKKEALLKTYYLALGESIQVAEQKAAERARKDHSFAKIKAKVRDDTGDTKYSNEQGVASRHTAAG